MSTTKILYVGTHQAIQETVVRLINKQENWSGQGVKNAEDAMECLKKSDYDIVLLGCGIAEEAEANLRNFIAQDFPKIAVVQHYGGGSGLLANEIMETIFSGQSSF